MSSRARLWVLGGLTVLVVAWAWGVGPPVGIEHMVLVHPGGVQRADTGDVLVRAADAGWEPELGRWVVVRPDGGVELRREGAASTLLPIPLPPDPRCAEHAWSVAPGGRHLFLERRESHPHPCTGAPNPAWRGFIDLETFEAHAVDHPLRFLAWRGGQALVRGADLPALHLLDPAAPLLAERAHWIGQHGHVYAASDDGRVVLASVGGPGLAVLRPDEAPQPLYDLVPPVGPSCVMTHRADTLSADGRFLIARGEVCPADDGTRRDRVVAVDLQAQVILFDRLFPMADPVSPPAAAPGPIARLAWSSAVRGRLRWHILSADEGGVRLRTARPAPGFYSAGMGPWDASPRWLQPHLNRWSPPVDWSDRGTAAWTDDGEAIVVQRHGEQRWVRADSGRGGERTVSGVTQRSQIQTRPPQQASWFDPPGTWSAFPAAERASWPTPPIPATLAEELDIPPAAAERLTAQQVWSRRFRACREGDALACWRATTNPARLESPPSDRTWRRRAETWRRIACIEGIGAACRAPAIPQPPPTPVHPLIPPTR